MSEPIICGISYTDFIIRMEEFHGYRSPGILLGGFMLDAALQDVGTTPYLNVVSETVVCLPDAIQLLTPCTVGNGFLQIFDWGKFALTAYDRMTLSGMRVWLNHDSLSRYALIRDWFERSDRTKEKTHFEELAREILQAGRELIICRSVRLHRALKDTQPVPTGRCSKCGEFYALRHGSTCPSCQGNTYYDYQTAGHRPAGNDE